MKKVTLLMMLFIASIGASAQASWDFSNSLDNWTNVVAAKSLKADYVELTSKLAKANPGLRLQDAGELAKINTTNTHLLAITLKNKSAVAPNQIKVVIVTTGGTVRAYGDMTVGNTVYQTYYIDLTNAKWTGTVSDVKINFATYDKQDFVGTGAEIFDIDKIEFTDAIPLTEKNSYTFDQGFEGFTTSNGSFNWTTGKLSFTPTVAKYAKLNQIQHYADATANKTLKISLTNNSPANNQLRFVFVKADGTNSSAITMPMTTSDAGPKEYTFDLSGLADWTGNRTFIIGIGEDTDNKPVDAGVVDFHSVIFSAALSNDIITKDDAQLSIYPNPVVDFLTVKASSKVESVKVYNVTGQEVISSTEATVNTASLPKGIYIVKIAQENGAISTKRFIK